MPSPAQSGMTGCRRASVAIAASLAMLSGPAAPAEEYIFWEDLNSYCNKGWKFGPSDSMHAAVSITLGAVPEGFTEAALAEAVVRRLKVARLYDEDADARLSVYFAVLEEGGRGYVASWTLAFEQLRPEPYQAGELRYRQITLVRGGILKAGLAVAADLFLRSAADMVDEFIVRFIEVNDSEKCESLGRQRLADRSLIWAMERLAGCSVNPKHGVLRGSDCAFEIDAYNRADEDRMNAFRRDAE